MQRRLVPRSRRSASSSSGVRSELRTSSTNMRFAQVAYTTKKRSSPILRRPGTCHLAETPKWSGVEAGGTGDVVAQTGSLLCRGLAIRRASFVGTRCGKFYAAFRPATLPTDSRRHRRLPTCATLSAASPLRCSGLIKARPVSSKPCPGFHRMPSVKTLSSPGPPQLPSSQYPFQCARWRESRPRIATGRDTHRRPAGRERIS